MMKHFSLADLVKGQFNVKVAQEMVGYPNEEHEIVHFIQEEEKGPGEDPNSKGAHVHPQVKRPFESLPGVRFQENVDYDKLFSSLSDNAKDNNKSAPLRC